MAKTDIPYNPFLGSTTGPGSVGVIGVSGLHRDQTNRAVIKDRLRTEMATLSANPPNTALSKVIECLRFLLEDER